MLSLILYGRNDSHGYNLHKRAALSLNAMAEVLSAPNDEIIFVDYNTPDELPTFIETVADTLTDRAKQRLRVIRVRPSYHRQFARSTSLVALESQSRNIAVRRANPDNRWILSTNTDMIFIPAAEDSNLSAICAGLADGFYHLPRFELPESFWERADRKNPRAMIDALRFFGRRYHLNEVVYGGYDNIYEAPGDFQLFLREDLFEIRGFDETMIKGWHVDTNTARRMRLLRGKVDTAFPLLLGYHCGHTRQATSLHGAKRTENSVDAYIRNVKSARWTESTDDWGAPSEAFEEIRVEDSRTNLFLKALDSAIAESGPTWSQAVYNETTFCEEGFDAAHVVPHLGDLIFNMAPKQTLYLIATDEGLVESFTQFVSARPMEANLIACADENSPGSRPRLKSASLEEGLASADLIIIQFPNARTVAKDKRADLEWFAQNALERFIAIERTRPAANRRRIIVVNGIHTRLQDLIWDALDTAAIPYSGRVRHGRVVDAHWCEHRPANSTPVERTFYSKLGRIRTFGPAEIEALGKVFSAASSGVADIPEWHRLAPEILAVTEHPDFLESHFGYQNEEHVSDLAARARAEIADAGMLCAATPLRLPPRLDTPNRIASATDWEDESWLALARRYFGEQSYSTEMRSRWMWERLSLLHELERRIPASTKAWVLVLGDAPDPLVAMIAHRGFRVAYATTSDLLSGKPTGPWTETLRINNLVLHSSVVPLQDIPSATRFSAVISPGASLFSSESYHPDAVIAIVARHMLPGAHLGASALVRLDGKSGGRALDWQNFRDAFLPGGVLSVAGVEADAPVDARIPLETVLRHASNDRQSNLAAGLSFGNDPSSIVSIGTFWGRFPTPACEATTNNASPPLASKALMVSEADRVVPHSRPEISADLLNSDDRVAAHAAAAATLLSSALFFPALFHNSKRQLLPYLVSANISERSMTHVVLLGGTEQRVMFAIPIADFGPGGCRLVVKTTGTFSNDAKASFFGSINRISGNVLANEDAIEITFTTTHPVGDGIAIVEVPATSLHITQVAGTRQPI